MNLDDLFAGNPASPSKWSDQFGGRYAQNQARAGERSDGEDIHVTVDVPRSVASRGGMVQFEYQRVRRTDGLEVQSVLELFYLRVPASTRDGEVLDIEKMGHTGLNGGRSGDLHCTVNIVADQSPEEESTTTIIDTFIINRQANTNQPISDGVVQITFPEAVLGGRVCVNTPEGEVTISIPAGTSSGRKFRIRGKGD